MNVFFNILAGAIGILLVSNGLDWLKGHYNSTSKKAWGFVSIIAGISIIVVRIAL